MLEIIFALAPIFILILMGYTAKRQSWLEDGFWSPAELITYYVFFPALLFSTTATTDVRNLEILPMGFVLVSSVLLISALAIKLRPYLDIDDAAFTSLFQGVIRPNSYVAIAGAFALWGDAGLTLIAIAIALIVPLVNFLSVIVMETYGAPSCRREGPPRLKSLFYAVARNPLILACVLGVSINLSGAPIPIVIDELTHILGRAALPIGLLCVGAGLDVEAAKKAGKTMLASSLIKLAVLPLICFVCATLIGLEGITRDISVYYAAMPVSASSFVLARKMGGDSQIMAGIITLTTLLAMLSLPFLLQMIKLL